MAAMPSPERLEARVSPAPPALLGLLQHQELRESPQHRALPEPPEPLRCLALSERRESRVRYTASCDAVIAAVCGSHSSKLQ